MSDEKDFYSNFSSNSSGKNNLKSNVFIPFISGVLGASLVLGISFGVPSIRNTFETSSNTDYSNSSAVETSSSGTTEFISLNNYSDTAIYAAGKVLPSIVGITVEYTVTSNFIQGMSRAFFC